MYKSTPNFTSPRTERRIESEASPQISQVSVLSMPLRCISSHKSAIEERFQSIKLCYENSSFLLVDFAKAKRDENLSMSFLCFLLSSQGILNPLMKEKSKPNVKERRRKDHERASFFEYFFLFDPFLFLNAMRWVSLTLLPPWLLLIERRSSPPYISIKIRACHTHLDSSSSYQPIPLCHSVETLLLRLVTFTFRFVMRT